MLARATMLVLACALLWAPAALAGGGAAATPEYFQWQPNGSTSGPQLLIQVKLDVTGDFGVQCGKYWIYASFGGGEADPIKQNASASTISGSISYPTNTVGIGSSYEAAESDYELVRSGGPLVMTLNAQVTPSIAEPTAAPGTLSLTMYTLGSTLPSSAATARAHARRGRHKRPRRRHKHSKKPSKVAPSVIASCQISFDATNYYG